MGVGLGGSMWWNPPAPGSSMANTDWGRLMLEQNPQTAFYRLTRELGIPDDNSAFARWAAQRFPQFQLGYNAYTIDNPLTANIVDYSKTLGGFSDWWREFKAQAPQLRGEDPSSRGAGPVRWISR